MQWIKDIVTGLIETYGTRDVYKLLGYLEVTIIMKNFVNPDVKARLYRDPFGKYFIYLSYDLEEHEKIIILLHELGHILLHDISCEYYYKSRIHKGKLEYQANYFVSLMLLDESNFDRCNLENLTLNQLSAYFEVPMELIQYRLGEVI